VMWTVLVFAVPRATIWLLAFWQRLFFGGPTKRIPDERIATLWWLDFTSFPYRLRRVVGRLLRARREVDLNLPGRPFATRVLKVLSFIPTVVAMMVPIAVGAVLSRAVPDPRISIGWYLAGLLAFTLYLILCAACELVASWQAVLKELGLAGAVPEHRGARKSARRS